MCVPLKTRNKILIANLIMGKLFIIIVILLLVGLGNAAYVSAEKSSGGTVACYIVDGCDRVLSSPYAYLAGVPLYIWGIVYYALGLLLLALASKEKISRNIFFAYMCVGTAASLVFLYLQAFVIEAFCFSCLLSALFIFTLTILAWFYMRSLRGLAS